MTLLREMLTKKLQSASALRIEKRIRNFFLSPRDAIVYGAGHQARIILTFCRFFKKNVSCLFVSPPGKIDMQLKQFNKDIAIYFPENFPENTTKNDYDVIIAVNEKYTNEIEESLKKYKFNNTFSANNWTTTNEAVRDFWYDAYFLFKGAELVKDENGNRYISYKFRNTTWSFYFYAPTTSRMIPKLWNA